jgi:hypothetical protein
MRIDSDLIFCGAVMKLFADVEGTADVRMCSYTLLLIEVQYDTLLL